MTHLALAALLVVDGRHGPERQCEQADLQSTRVVPSISNGQVSTAAQKSLRSRPSPPDVLGNGDRPNAGRWLVWWNGTIMENKRKQKKKEEWLPQTR